MAPRTAAAVPLLIDTPARTAALARPASSPALGTQPGLQTSTLLCLVLAAGYRLRTTAPTHQHCSQQSWPGHWDHSILTRPITVLASLATYLF